jgi:hypothetical protein
MSIKSERKKAKYEEKKSNVVEITAGLEQVSNGNGSGGDDESMGRYEFRRITKEEKSHVVFNDGDFAFTIQFVPRSEDGILFSVAQFRTITSLTKEEFLKALPVVHDEFWHKNDRNKNGNTMLDIFAAMLREDWAKKLKGDVLFNDGERIVRTMLLESGGEGMDYAYRKDTDPVLTPEQYLAKYPVTIQGEQPFTAEMADKVISLWAELEESRKNPQHLTFDAVLPMLSSDKVEERHGEKVVELDSMVGFVKYSDANGGTATFVNSDDDSVIATFDAVITDEMRADKCTAPGCTCGGNKWDELLSGCRSDEHEDHGKEQLVPYRLFATFCDNPECTEQHIWILSECVDAGRQHNSCLFQLRQLDESKLRADITPAAVAAN